VLQKGFNMRDSIAPGGCCGSLRRGVAVADSKFQLRKGWKVGI
jgi:hypothetical protein